MTNQPSSVILSHSIPSNIVALPDDVLERTRELLGRAGAVRDITTAEEFRAADELCAAIGRQEKAIEDARTTVKRPVLDLGRAIDAACKDAIAPLNEARKAVGRAVMDWQRKERERLEAERRERERIAREEAERKAEEERARLEAEREAQRKRQAEAAELFGDDPAKLPPAPPVEVKVAPVSLPAVAAPKAHSVQTRKVKRLRIIDASKVPVMIGNYIVRVIDDRRLRDALMSGHLCEGAELVEEEEVVGRGAR